MIKKLSVIILTITLLSLTTVLNKLSGTYRSNSEWSGHYLELKPSGTFIQIQSGCVYEIKTKGKWLVIDDILELSIHKQQNLRIKKRWTDVKRKNKFIIRNDSLFGLYGNDSIRVNTFDPSFSLTRMEK